MQLNIALERSQMALKLPSWRLRLAAGLGAFVIAVAALIASAPGAHAESSVLGSGQTLGTGGKLVSADGHYTLIMQTDSNLVTYAWPRPYWASNTSGKNPYNDSILTMQGDGNLVMYSHNHVAIWASNTAGKNGAYLALQNDGNLVVISADGRTALWASGGVDAQLDPGQMLWPNQQFQSPNRQYRMVMQSDGNLVLYQGATARWSSKTYRANSTLEMQGDGNLVIYAPGHIAVWATGTFKSGSVLRGQNDGNFVLYAPGNAAVWATNTSTVKPADPTSPTVALKSCPTMSQGSAGVCVALLQQYLNGTNVGPSLATDGVFGPLTKQAVTNYQSSRGLTADGIAGPQTLNALATYKPVVGSTPPPVTHKYPSSFNPAAAANWAVSNALVQLWIPQSATQMLQQIVTGSYEKEPCTAFASAAMAGGGMPKEADWFPYVDANTQEHALFLYMSSNMPVANWYAANNFVSRFVSSKGYAVQRQIYPTTSNPMVSLGDVIYYQWDGTANHPHLAVVTSIVNGEARVTDQGASALHSESINRRLYFGWQGNDLRKDAPSMKVFVLHWQ
jgi:hypothetical protein